MARRWVAALVAVLAFVVAQTEEIPDPEGGVTVEPIGVPGERMELVFEPVFQGQALMYEAGQSHPYSVVLVHGLGDKGMRDFAHLIPALAERYHVVAFDLPGFGQSTKQNVLYSPALYAAFVKWAVERSVGGPFAVIGHSLGGAVALRFAATFPRDLDRLILADVAGILDQVAMSKYLVQSKVGAMLPNIPGGVQQRLLRDFTSQVIDRLQRLPIDMDVALGGERARDKMLSSSPSTIAALALLEEDYSRLLGTVATPSLIIWGADDQVTPMRTAKVLEARMPNARLELIPDSGHVPMRDRPEAFARRIFAELENPPRTQRLERSVVGRPATDRIGRCENESGVVFVGAYDEISINGCMAARLLDVTARSVLITNSEVEVESSRILGDEVGVMVRSSTFIATASTFKGQVAIEASGSRLDLAGVELIGSDDALRSPDRSVLVASVCKVDSPHPEDFLHGHFEITPERPL